MKNQFREYYPPSQASTKRHWETGVFSFDANVLLNLYRYSPSTRQAFFKLLEKVSDRLWISYQAAFEYHKNRLTVINAQMEAYQEIRATLQSKRNEIENKLNGFKKHPYLHADELKTQIESAFAAISRDLDRIEKDHPNYLDTDPILDRITLLLQGKVGDDFAPTELEAAFKEGKRRYEEKVPPGYMDQKDKKDRDNRSLYGDLIVWKQVVEYTKVSKKPLIFVTDDLKEDWWYKFKGRTISPRPELLKEFSNLTGQRVQIYQADRFLELANKNLQQNTSQVAIDEIRNVRLADEDDLSLGEYSAPPDSKSIVSDALKPMSFDQIVDEYISASKKRDAE
ncbi:MAG: hypothetical protein HWE25_09425 [Alphaproteobacteria bacterium]|nr:hypothetical protein [Alphaproteobacteria bacterium]